MAVCSLACSIKIQEASVIRKKTIIWSTQTRALLWLTLQTWPPNITCLPRPDSWPYQSSICTVAACAKSSALLFPLTHCHFVGKKTRHNPGYVRPSRDHGLCLEFWRSFYLKKKELQNAGASHSIEIETYGMISEFWILQKGYLPKLRSIDLCGQSWNLSKGISHQRYLKHSFLLWYLHHIWVILKPLRPRQGDKICSKISS